MPHHVTVYSKPGCHLCEITGDLLKGLHGEFDFTEEEIDITRDSDLLQRFGEKIPVVVIDNRVTLAAPIRRRQLVSALRAVENGGER